MENNGQESSSPSHISANAQQNSSPGTGSQEQTHSSPNNTINNGSNVLNGIITGPNLVISRTPRRGVTVTNYLSILLRNPIPVPPTGGPPPPVFSRVTRARILHILVSQSIEGDYDQILEATAREIPETHPYFIQDNIINIPQTNRLYVIQYNDDETNYIAAEDDWDFNVVPSNAADDDMGQESDGIQFYEIRSEGGDDTTMADLVQDDVTIECWPWKLIYGLPEYVVHRQLRSEEYNLTPETQPEESCRICLDGDRTAKLDCGDLFYYDCISHWLTIRNVCSLCCRAGIYP